MDATSPNPAAIALPDAQCPFVVPVNNQYDVPQNHLIPAPLDFDAADVTTKPR